MATAESTFNSASLKEAVSTRADNQTPVTGSSDVDARHKWLSIVDEKFIDWAVYPQDFEDDGIAPPSREKISLAGQLATKLADMDVPAPSRVVFDANGGIVFERHDGSVFEAIIVSSDLNVEYRRFLNDRLVDREPWHFDDM